MSAFTINNRMNVYLIILSLIPKLTMSSDAHVQTPLGRVKGLELTDKETSAKIYQFRGIRYAKAPIGGRRFRKPEAVEAWNDEYDATEFGYACPQIVIDAMEDGSERQSEDCLNLNVYVPYSLAKNEKLSVMVWIHGGDLVIGNGFSYDGTRLALEGNVVVVTINYRLGNLGFMSLYHPACRGNFGLWDQILALEWVQNNIVSFRGNSGSVTIFGESSGGYCVTYLALIPLNKGLFHRVIAQSGVAGRFNVPRRRAVEENARKISERTKCPMSDPDSFIDCLRNIHVDNFLVDMMDLPEDKIEVECKIGPVVDGELFPAHPVELVEDPDSPQSIFFGSLDFIAGGTSQEGIIYVAIPPKGQEMYKFSVIEGISSEFVLKGMIKPFVDVNYNGNPELEDKLLKFYISHRSSDEQSNLAADLLADIYFTPYIAEMLKNHDRMKNGMTYQYQISKSSPGPLEPPPPWFKGCGHAEDLIYFFYSENTQTNVTAMPSFKLSDAEKDFAKTMMRYWTSFAKTGVPSAGEEFLPWLQYDSKKKIYMDFDLDISLRQNWKSKNVHFWAEEIPPISTDSSVQRDEL